MFRSERDGTADGKVARRPDLGGRSTVYGTKGAVACEHPGAALAGIRVLDAGGNAADACVAMAACMAVVAPMATGMGGDAFLLFYEAEAGRVLGANGSGRAPRAATVEKLRERGLSEMSERGGLPITVPGAVRLWEDAASSLGNLPLARLLEPAWEFAESGYPVSEVFARYWGVGEDLLLRNEAAARALLIEGRAPEAGEVFQQPDLAATLSAVAEDGADAFYGGGKARGRGRPRPGAGGYLSEEDLEAEAKKLAYRDLYEEIGDPEFWRHAEIQTGHLISKEYAAALRERISPDRASGRVAEPALGEDTTYLCAVDADGNGCSFINSLYIGFGSGVVAEGTGVCLQNRGKSFQLDPDHPNALEPGKRPMHTIIPGLATSSDTGALWATFGVMGGPMQPQGHIQLLSNLIDHRMSPQEAVDHPRHFHEDDTLLIESRVRACGSDPRKDGCALAQ